ncbi:abscisic acid 8'-hydroxylase CYP707A1-like [Cornus florida]|uniref:abscisic acid 8'-hydroxylase CYP707A1-like n=1 Tax=Cornus florida TaxID=4283 RepID=UPI002897C2CF|nr:abscisic acid 8'-hydroxylase CYP707A1-like [Cornus florida]
MEGGLPYMSIFLVLAIALISFFLFKERMKSSPQTPKLPPGSMGWPYLGETLQLFSQNPHAFFHTRHKKFGEIFKTHILGCPSIMLACPEAARFVLVTDAHLFKPSYPKSKEELIGRWAVFFHQGGYHTRMRKLVQSSLSLDVIRNLLPAIEAIAISILDSWCVHDRVINTFHEIKKFTFDVAVLSIFGELDCKYGEQLKKNYFTLDKGYNCFPINLPGTLYRRAFMARRRLSQILSDIISDRREKRILNKNLLSSLLNFKDENGETLNNDQIADNIIGVLFAAQDTTASVLTWVLKYIHDDPKLLEAIKMEQKAVYESNDGGSRPLTWAQTRNMPLTQRVVMESLRMSSIISFTYREAVEDVEYNGILIPKGWKVLPLFRIIHHNPDFFTDPEKFDPSRFEVGQKPNTFIPFGNGSHACPGNEVAKLEMLILIHHLVNKYRWEVVGDNGGVQYDPFPVPKKGLSAKFWKVSGDQGHGVTPAYC